MQSKKVFIKLDFFKLKIKILFMTKLFSLPFFYRSVTWKSISIFVI